MTKLSKYEKETIINWNEAENTASTARPMKPSPKTVCGSVCSVVPPTRWTFCPLTGPEIAGSCR